VRFLTEKSIETPPTEHTLNFEIQDGGKIQNGAQNLKNLIFAAHIANIQRISKDFCAFYLSY
jgi:hypothetical protein